MIQIEITLNQKHYKTVTFSTPKTLNEIMADIEAPSCRIVGYKINNEYINGTVRMDKNTRIEIVLFNSYEGLRIYQDSVIFLMNMAFQRLVGDRAIIQVEHSIGDGVYCEVSNTSEKLTESDIEFLKKEMINISNHSYPIEKLTMTIEEAERTFSFLKRFDILKNLSFDTRRSMTVFKCEDYFDYYPRPIAPHTGLLNSFEIVFKEPGFILRFPDQYKCEIKADFELPKLLFAAHQEHDKWLNILKVQTIGDLNKLIDNYKISEFIQVEEALHEKKIAYLADQIKTHKKARFVLIAGPSSSGKTTFAKRLAVQLRVNGFQPLVIGMDDYFLPRSLTPRLENGEYDFESIHSLDLPLLNEHLLMLLEGKEIEIPKYNFVLGARETGGEKLRLKPENILIMEGIHGINDMLTASIPAENKVKIYISALNQLNIDFHNRIATTDCRKIRRIARDFRYRGYSAEETLSRFDSVRQGEDKNIFPYQESVNFMFNSSLTYELGILKKHVLPQLRIINSHSQAYSDAQHLIILLDHIKDIQDDLVPTNSLLREFTYGSVFKY